MRLRADYRELRIKEAEERNASWRALSVSEQIKSLRERRGESRRQMAKLTANEKGT